MNTDATRLPEPGPGEHPFAYLFERFPSFTQTFCAREVEEMFRQGMNPCVLAIRSHREDKPTDFPDALARKVINLPPKEELLPEMTRLRHERQLPRPVLSALNRWGDAGDKTRVYEAARLGPILRAAKIRHVHAHFAGIAARTAYWLKKFYGIGYSFTGHANDMFCETTSPVSLADLVREAVFVATVTDFSRAWLRGKFPRDAAKVFRVFNGIRIDRFRTAAPAPTPRILSVGRYIEKKGFADLIEACGILKARGIEFECRIVGEGPLEEELRSQISRAALDREVQLTGPRAQPEVIAMLAESSLFVLPCVHEADGGMDNLPTVIIEAMASALPVISTPVAGVPEMVADGETGWLVPERDTAALADAIARALADPPGARKLGMNGRVLAEARFSTEVTTRALKRLMVFRAGVRPPPSAVTLDPELKHSSLKRWLARGPELP